MNLKKCDNGHFYDADKYVVCPHCKTTDDITFPGDDIMPDDFYIPTDRTVIEPSFESRKQKNMFGPTVLINEQEDAAIDYLEIEKSGNAYEINIKNLAIYNTETVIEAKINVKPYKKYDYLYIIGLPESYVKDSVNILTSDFEFDSMIYFVYDMNERIKALDEFKKIKNSLVKEEEKKILINNQINNIHKYMEKKAERLDSIELYVDEIEKCNKLLSELYEKKQKNEQMIESLKVQIEDLYGNAGHLCGIKLRMIADSVVDKEITIKFSTKNIYWIPEYELYTLSSEDFVIASLIAKIYIKMNYKIEDAFVSIISGDDNSAYVPKMGKYILKKRIFPETLPTCVKPISLNDIVDQSNDKNETSANFLRQAQIVDETTVNSAYMSYNSSKPHLQIVDEDDFIKRTEYRLANKLSLNGYENISITILKEKMNIIKKYIAMPSKSSNVYIWIDCDKIIDFLEYDAKVNIFYDEKKVDTKYTYSIDEKVGITLGTTRNINVSRNIKASDSRYVNMKKNKQMMMEYAIKVENKRDKEIKLTVMDNIPVTDEDEVSIDIVKDSNAKLDKKTGICNWEISLPANSERNLEVEYVISYPASLNIIREQ